MNDKLKAFYDSLNGKNVTFLGIGVSNTPLIYKFAECGAKITACDKRTREKLGNKADTLEAAGVKLVLGENYLDGISGDIIVRTPGINYLSPQLQNARRNGSVLTSEMELFFDLCPAKIYAVTGSDGKTTTTTIISKFLEAEGKKIYLGGNIGTPLFPLVDEMTADDYAVVELSSFQLMSMRRSADVAVVTNVAPNHLDIHKDMQEYIDAKKNVFLHQTAATRTVLNAENDITASFAGDVRGYCMMFSEHGPLENGVFTDENDDIIAAYMGKTVKIMNAADIKIPGRHNVQNYLAAIAAVIGSVKPETIKKVAEEFGGVEHRIEYIRTINGARWYNDSIATSPTRAIAGINSFDRRLILIAGGYDKHIPFAPFAERAVKGVKILILCGATSAAIEKAIKEQPEYNEKTLEIINVSTMEDAVKTAYSRAENGDIVTLCPACASFDMYPNFAARGNHFKQLVNAL